MKTENIIKNYEYDPVKDVFLKDGRVYIENTFGNGNRFIDITGSKWTVYWQGKPSCIDWNINVLPKDISQCLVAYAKHKLKSNSPSYIDKIRLLRDNLSRLLPTGHTNFSNISPDDFIVMWQEFRPVDRSYLRSFYRWLADNNLCGAKKYLAAELKEWKAREEVGTLKFVTDWNPTKGAYTLNEWEKLKNVIQVPYDNLPDTERTPHALYARSFCWLSMLCGKRPSQLYGIKKEGGIYKIGNEWIIKVRPVKAQTGRKYINVIITDNDLIDLIEKFSAIPEVNLLQKQYNRLFITKSKTLPMRMELTAYDAPDTYDGWWRSNGFISERTNDLITLTPYRIRHTFATNLAMNNVPREIIAELLEHDSIDSAAAYINACASRLSKELNKVDRNSGMIFTKLNNIYFDGIPNPTKDVDEDKAIYIPGYTLTPLIVGSCKKDTIKDGLCEKHPFLGCYTCISFRPWEDGKHDKSLQYVLKEEEKIKSADSTDTAKRDLEILDNAKKGIKDVQRRIRKMASTDV